MFKEGLGSDDFSQRNSGAPDWCGYEAPCSGAPFDPEGLVSSLTAVVASLFGAHVGRVAFAFPVDTFNAPSGGLGGISGGSGGGGFAGPRMHNDRLYHWGFLAALSAVVGLALHLSGASPFNTDLYSPSFLLLTNGASLFGFMACYRLADVAGGWWTHLLLDPFKWLGMNSIAIYILSCSGITEAVLSVVYWGEPDNNLANVFWPTGVFWGPKDFGWQPAGDYGEFTHQRKWVMVWVLCAYIPFWMALAYYLHRKKLYFKV